MGLFRSKKKDKHLEQGKVKPQPLPDFSDHTDLPEFPSRENAMLSDEDFDLGSFPSVSEGSKARVEDMPEVDEGPMPLTEMGPKGGLPRQALVSMPELDEGPLPGLASGDKQFFVKIDKYEDAVNTLNEIKKLSEEAENVLNRLRDIKQKEDYQIETWERSLENIKSKVLRIDKDLFQGKEQF